MAFVGHTRGAAVTAPRETRRRERLRKTLPGGSWDVSNPAPQVHAPVERPGSTRTSVTGTPDRTGRDPFVDVVRAVATCAVMTLHWLMPAASWDGHNLAIGNALATGNGWIATWLLETLGLLFFAAGAAAGYDVLRRLRRPGVASVSAWSVTRTRLTRLAWPVGAFLGSWTIAVLILPLTGLPAEAVTTLAHIAPQLLWFLGIYLVLVPFTGLLIRLCRRTAGRVGVPVVLLVLVAGGDVARFALGWQTVAWINVVAGWAVLYALGVGYAVWRTQARPARSSVHDDMLRRFAARAPGGIRWTWAGGAVVAFAAAGCCVAWGPYPVSLVGMPGAAVSNLAPPTMPVVLHGVGLVCLALAVRDPLVRWSTGAGRRVVGWVSARSMTIYLWHITAMLIVVASYLLVFPGQLVEPFGVSWWVTRPLWFGAFACTLLALCALFHRFETRRKRPVKEPVKESSEHSGDEQGAGHKQGAVRVRPF